MKKHSNSSQPQRPALFALRDVVKLAQVSTSCRAACCACRMASVMPSASMHVLSVGSARPTAQSSVSRQRVLLTFDSPFTDMNCFSKDTSEQCMIQQRQEHQIRVNSVLEWNGQQTWRTLSCSDELWALHGTLAGSGRCIRKLGAHAIATQMGIRSCSSSHCPKGLLRKLPIVRTRSHHCPT